jgi:Uma2 family endonuclease
MTPPEVLDEVDSLADLLGRLGDIEPRRVLLHPAPGTATVADLVARNERKHTGLVELVDGTLVEKVMGFSEGGLALDLAFFLQLYLRDHPVADLLSSSSPMRLPGGMVRLPDLALIRWERYPHRQRPREAVPTLVPDLAVEILSESNTAAEMTRKRREYFEAGTTLVWQIDPRRREVAVYTGLEQLQTLTEGDTLTGEPVLPGFTLPVSDLFRRVPPES